MNKKKKLYLSLSKGENFGWGVCSKYLNQEVSRIYQNTIIIDPDDASSEKQFVEGKVLHAIKNHEFDSLTNIRGTENFGYTFFENELNSKSAQNAEQYDFILGGSAWCKEKMLKQGIKNVGVLIQGIDPEVFYPIEEAKAQRLFVIFSGGKFELRKGQDIILKALRILQQKYSDIILINSWNNLWPEAFITMKNSRHINFELKGKNWQEIMKHIYTINGLTVSMIITMNLIKNEQLRDLYKKTDIGVFPNRCEGGTNLVLMEYMACGKPVIATYTSGHKDIITEKNSLLLNDLKPCKIYNLQNNLIADWEEPSVEELVSKIEYAYHHREEIRRIGKNAGEHLRNYTWEHSAKNLLNTLL